MLCHNKAPLHPEVETITAQGSLHGVEVEVCLRWSSDQYSENTVSFANGIKTGDGGTHVDGLKAVLTRTINSAARKVCKAKAERGAWEAIVCRPLPMAAGCYNT